MDEDNSAKEIEVTEKDCKNRWGVKDYKNRWFIFINCVIKYFYLIYLLNLYATISQFEENIHL